MLANIVNGQRMTFVKKLAKRGYFNQSKFQGIRQFSSVMGGQEGSTVSFTIKAFPDRLF